MSETEQWNVIKQDKLRYRCLRNNHFGKGYTRTRICGTDESSKSNKRILHETEMKNLQEAMKLDRQSNSSRAQKPPTTTGELLKQTEHEKTMNVKKQYRLIEEMLLRTILVVLKKRKQKVVANTISYSHVSLFSFSSLERL